MCMAPEYECVSEEILMGIFMPLQNQLTHGSAVPVSYTRSVTAKPGRRIGDGSYSVIGTEGYGVRQGHPIPYPRLVCVIYTRIGLAFPFARKE